MAKNEPRPRIPRLSTCSFDAAPRSQAMTAHGVARGVVYPSGPSRQATALGPALRPALRTALRPVLRTVLRDLRPVGLSVQTRRIR